MSAHVRSVSEIAEDAFDQLDVCRKTLRQMESLLWTLKKTHENSHEGRIAELGAHVALDIADLTEATTRDWRNELEAVGGAQ